MMFNGLEILLYETHATRVQFATRLKNAVPGSQIPLGGQSGDEKPCKACLHHSAYWIGPNIKTNSIGFVRYVVEIGPYLQPRASRLWYLTLFISVTSASAGRLGLKCEFHVYSESENRKFASSLVIRRCKACKAFTDHPGKRPVLTAWEADR